MSSIGGITGSSPSVPAGWKESVHSGGRADQTASGNGPAENLAKEDERLVEKMKETDRKVRAHEAAHQAAAGGLSIGGATFSFATGPDGNRYAVGGEVRIDTSEVPGRPEATILKMQQVERAALAPADPSGQDRKVAAQASATETKARQELLQKRAVAAKLPADPRLAAYTRQKQQTVLGKVYF